MPFTPVHMGPGLLVKALGLRIIREPQFLPLGWTVTIFSAFVGTYSHVLLDSVMHDDLQPFAPFTTVNPFLHFVSVDRLHEFCGYSGIVGAIAYFGVSAWLARRPAP